MMVRDTPKKVDISVVILNENIPMAAQPNPHVYMEMLEAGAHTLQELAEVRYPEVAGLAVGKQP